MRSLSKSQTSVALFLSLVAAAAPTGCSSTSANTTVTTVTTPAAGPPAGFTTVVAPTTDGRLGVETAMVADELGDPMIAYLWSSPSSSDEASAVYFTRWDRSVGAFTSPVKVDTVGAVSTSQPARQISLAYDATTKRLAIAYALVGLIAPNTSNASQQIYLQTSDVKGATWGGRVHVSDQKPGDGEQATAPSVAVSGGKIQIAYAQTNRACCRPAGSSCGGCASIWYLEGDGTTFTRTQVSDAVGPIQPETSVTSMAVDAAGHPALAFLGAPPTGYDTTVVYWRPGSSAPAIVMDSNNIQNDSASVSLAFDGIKPRIAAHLVAVASATYDLRVARADDGVSWSAAVELPRDGTQSTAWYQSLAIDSKGGAAVSAYVNGGSGDNVCGAPRVVRSSDLSRWSACGADTTKAYPGVNGKFVASYFGRDDKLSLVSTGTLGAESSGTGVIFWREP